MSKNRPIKFSGKVLRFEPDGFGLIQFDQPIGPSANTHGLISNSTGTTVLGGAAIQILKPGVRVTGLAEADEHDVAKVKSVAIESHA
jgi:hypothetical protein